MILTVKRTEFLRVEIPNEEVEVAIDELLAAEPFTAAALREGECTRDDLRDECLNELVYDYMSDAVVIDGDQEFWIEQE